MGKGLVKGNKPLAFIVTNNTLKTVIVTSFRETLPLWKLQNVETV